MVFRASDLEGARLAAIDGPIGAVVECLFDDRHWTVRYLVVDTGGWLSGRHVLISPGWVRDVDRPGGRVVVILTREQVRRSPEVDRRGPSSRRAEATDRDAHLHSARAVAGTAVRASDGHVGHVEDLLLEDQAWTIGSLVVDTGSGRPRTKILLSPESLEDVAWASDGIRVGLTREQIRDDAPEYHPDVPVHPDYEQRLIEYYGRPVWRKDAA